MLHLGVGELDLDLGGRSEAGGLGHCEPSSQLVYERQRKHNAPVVIAKIVLFLFGVAVWANQMYFLLFRPRPLQTNQDDSFHPDDHYGF